MQKNELKNVVAAYMGMQMVDQKPTYQRYKLQFKVDDKVWNFTCFMPWTKKDGSEKKGVNPNDLKMGQLYKLGYTEYQSETMTYPSKTLAAIFESDGEAVAVKPKEFLNPETVNKLTDAYFKARKPEDQEVNHYIGTIIRSLLTDQVQPLIAKFEENKK